MSAEKKESYYQIVKEFFHSLGIDGDSEKVSNENTYIQPPSHNAPDGESGTISRYRQLLVQEYKEYLKLYVELHPQLCKKSASDSPTNGNVPTEERTKSRLKKKRKRLFKTDPRLKNTDQDDSYEKMMYYRLYSEETCSSYRSQLSTDCLSTCYFSPEVSRTTFNVSELRTNTPTEPSHNKVRCVERTTSHHVVSETKEVQVDILGKPEQLESDSGKLRRFNIPHRICRDRSRKDGLKKYPRVLATHMSSCKTFSTRKGCCNKSISREDKGTNTNNKDRPSDVSLSIYEDIDEIEAYEKITPPLEFGTVSISSDDDVFESIPSANLVVCTSECSGLSSLSTTAVFEDDEVVPYQLPSKSYIDSFGYENILKQTDQSLAAILQSNSSVLQLPCSCDPITKTDEEKYYQRSADVSIVQSDLTLYYRCNDNMEALEQQYKQECALSINPQLEDLERRLLERVALVKHPEQIMRFHESCLKPFAASAPDLKTDSKF